MTAPGARPTRVLVLGSGGREHAMVRALATVREATIFCAPGNPGIATLAQLLPIEPTDVPAIVAAARMHAIELVIPGPESALVAGVGDALAEAGIACCGPTRAAAQLEASKAFMRTLTATLGVPGPHFVVVSDLAALKNAVAGWEGVPVLKASGLAGGKGVFVCSTKDECVSVGDSLLNGALGAAGKTLVLEHQLSGEEASLFYACHGTTCVPLPHARDHKRLLDGNRGPNTGGMGATSPHPQITTGIEREIRERIVLPTLRALVERKTPFVGFLYAGIMLTAEGPRLLEFNVRLGDPEAQAILPRLADGEFLRLCTATAAGQLGDFSVEISDQATCAVVLASEGYPHTFRTGDRIAIDPDAVAATDAWVLHNGTRIVDGELLTAGGRILTVIAGAPDAETARERAYRASTAIQFSGRQLRTDIGRP